MIALVRVDRCRLSIGAKKSKIEDYKILDTEKWEIIYFMQNNNDKTKESIKDRLNKWFSDCRRKKYARKEKRNARRRNRYKYSDFFVSVGKARNEFMTIVILVFFAIILIVIGNIYALYQISENAVVYDQAAQSSLLSTGLSIIAIAIAVWAGLNIIQILGNNRLNEIFKEYSRFEKERKELYKSQFLHELKLQDRSMTQYLCKKIQKATQKKDDIPSNIYYRLYILEKNYENVYSKQAYKIRKYDEYSLTSLTTEIYNINQEISNSKLCLDNYLVIEEYLKSRSAELNFNFGYDDSDDFISDSILCFENTVKIYQDLYSINQYIANPEEYDTFVSDLVSYIMVQMGSENDDQLYINSAIHVINTIAESYSKLAHKYLSISKKQNNKIASLYISKTRALEYISNAIYYFNILMDYKNSHSDCTVEEFVYRNYGAALERQCQLNGRVLNFIQECDQEMISKIRDAYISALERELSIVGTKNLKEGVFYAYGSFYMKVIGKIPLFYSVNFDKKMDMERWTDSVYEYMKIAVALFPKQIVFYKILGIAMTYKIQFLINRNEYDSIKKEASSLNELIDEIDTLSNVRDDYRKMLDDNWEKIKKKM